MNAQHLLLKTFTLITVAALALVACGGQTASPTRVVSTPIPTVAAQPTTAPKPTTAPTQAQPNPTKAAPTQPKPAPTNAQTQPTAQPTSPAPQPTGNEKPTSAPESKPTENVSLLPMGKPQALDDLSIVPTKFEWLTQSGSDKPKAGNAFLVVTVSLENVSKTASISFDPAHLLIVGTSGAAIQMEQLKSIPTELKAETLKPGQKIAGVIVYELPQTQEKDKWVLQFKGQNNQLLEWSLAG